MTCNSSGVKVNATSRLPFLMCFIVFYSYKTCRRINHIVNHFASFSYLLSSCNPSLHPRPRSELLWLCQQMLGEREGRAKDTCLHPLPSPAPSTRYNCQHAELAQLRFWCQTVVCFQSRLFGMVYFGTYQRWQPVLAHLKVPFWVHFGTDPVLCVTLGLSNFTPPVILSSPV